MGKTPGKWIKTVLFGKKSSKSNLSKKAQTEREAFIVAKAPSSDLDVNPPLISAPVFHTTDRSGENSGLEKGTTGNLPHDAGALLPQSQAADTKGTMGLGSPNDAEMHREEQAATKVQAALRGYLARRAFFALKGIIRLQALIRGHLVRRQAVATLHCVQGIVKLQALVRGRRVRLSDAALEVHKRCSLGKLLNAKMIDSSKVVGSTRLQKLSKNAFISKLLASLPTAMPLSLQYDPVESNSAWNWLERWSLTRFWEPLKQPKRVQDSKSQRKQVNNRSVETEPGRPKRGVRRVPTVHTDNNPLLSTSEYEKPKSNLRKALSHQAESVQDNPQYELERVKRNLRKVSVSMTEANERSEAVTEKPKQKPKKVPSSPAPEVSEQIMDDNDRSEAVTEKPKQKPKKVPSSPAPDVSEQVMDDSSEKTGDPAVMMSKEPETEIPPKALAVDEPVDVLHNECPAVELHPIERSGKDENVSMVNEELHSMEDQTSKENQRTRRRRSLPSKQEYPDNGSQNTPTLPSYMAATESAKAKLRGQGSPRFGQDGAENGFIRRHSLPSSTNGKLSSLSPRIQRLAQSSGRGPKSDRSLLSSRDGHEKVIQAEWRR